MKKLSIVLASWCAFSSAPALAWDSFGHMEVAAVAWSKLTPKARARVADLLKVNPNYDILTKDASPDNRDQIAFVVAATWPDLIKFEIHGYTADGPEKGDRPPPGPEASQNVGYSDHFMHKYWHFVDTPFSTDGTALIQPGIPNAQTQIALFRAALSSNASDDIKSYDLVWLEHLVGDMHQPLHATSRFTQARPQGDAGGNEVKIDCGGCSATELHAFWDDVLGTSDKPQDAIQAASNLPAAPAALAAVADGKVWIKESFDAAKANAYSNPIGPGLGPFSLTAGYKSTAQTIANQRVALAGARLANLLNAAFK